MSRDGGIHVSADSACKFWPEQVTLDSEIQSPLNDGLEPIRWENVFQLPPVNFLCCWTGKLEELYL